METEPTNWKGKFQKKDSDFQINTTRHRPLPNSKIYFQCFWEIQIKFFIEDRAEWKWVMTFSINSNFIFQSVIKNLASKAWNFGPNSTAGQAKIFQFLYLKLYHRLLIFRPCNYYRVWFLHKSPILFPHVSLLICNWQAI